MQFTLTYSGALNANGKSAHKHELRQCFHTQLLVLWEQIPLSEYRYWFETGTKPTTIDLNRRVGSFRFVPLVSSSIHLICELRIFLLKPEPPGTIITQAGDIDNRLKTLFDALRVPTESEIPSRVEPQPGEDPFFCLLENDSLISRISVETDRLLIRTKTSNEVHLDIQVNTLKTRTLVGNRASGNIGLP
jgi:hypothetical protein